VIAISFYVIGGAFHGYGAVFKAELRGLDPQIRLAGRRANVFRNLQPWFTNTLKRIVKTPKLHFLDSGLLASVRGLTFDRVKADRGTFGALLESFVFSEVLKLMTASDLRLTPYHFRDRDMREVDIVLERDDGMIAGIEVKASATVKAGDFGGLRALAEACGDRFAFGVVLYDNTDVVPFGDKLAAVPLSSMWG
jgi:predicted AAA+ superfamily ATPase